MHCDLIIRDATPRLICASANVPYMPLTEVYCDIVTANIAETVYWRDNRPFGAIEPRMPYSGEQVMTLRKTTAIYLATAVISAAFAVSANAATMHHSTMHHPHAAKHHSMRGRMGAPHNAGSAATDQLNEQSLNSARGGAAPMSGRMPMSGQAPAQMPMQSPTE